MTQSAADLAAACLLFPLSFPAQLPFSLPDRPSASIEHWKSRWTGNAAVRWMEGIFFAHR